MSIPLPFTINKFFSFSPSVLDTFQKDWNSLLSSIVCTEFVALNGNFVKKGRDFVKYFPELILLAEDEIAQHYGM